MGEAGNDEEAVNTLIPSFTASFERSPLPHNRLADLVGGVGNSGLGKREQAELENRTGGGRLLVGRGFVGLGRGFLG